MDINWSEKEGEVGGSERMEEISRGICMGILGFLSWEDVRRRKLSLRILILGGGAALIYQLFCGTDSLGEIALGGSVGVCFLIIGKVTGEKIGYGDGITILILGIYLGIWELLEVLAGTFFLLAVTGMICLVGKRFSRKQTLPFCPFLTAGYMIFLLCKGG